MATRQWFNENMSWRLRTVDDDQADVIAWELAALECEPESERVFFSGVDIDAIHYKRGAVARRTEPT
jgi:hypothetical protein